jgi:hypothetical protein
MAARPHEFKMKIAAIELRYTPALQHFQLRPARYPVLHQVSDRYDPDQPHLLDHHWQVTDPSVGHSAPSNRSIVSSGRAVITSRDIALTTSFLQRICAVTRDFAN